MKLRLLTFNILHGGILWDSLVAFIHEIRPDILVIQEVYDGHKKSLENRYRTIEKFKKEFGEFLPYCAFGATVIDSAVNVPWGNAVFSKFPILNSRTIFFNIPFGSYDFSIDSNPRITPEGMLETEVDIVGKRTFVYSWHGVWDTHGNDTPERKIMEEKMIKALKDKRSIILAGDSNLLPTTQFVKNLELKVPIRSVFGNTLKSTFNMLRKSNPGYASAAVDMVFVTSNFKIIEKKMLTPDASDHYPLFVEFEVIE